MPGGQAQRFLIADDHPLFRGALRQALSVRHPAAAIEEAGSLDDIVARLGENDDFDLIFLDLAMPGMRRFSGLLLLRAQYPGVPVVIVSGNEEPQSMRQAIQLGASGYIPKSTAIQQFGEAIAAVMSGEVWVPPEVMLAAEPTDDLIARLVTLTPQQVRVLMMLSEGLLNKQIAYELGVSEATVKAHVSAVLQKLGVDSRTQAVIAASKIEAGDWQTIAH